MSHLEDLEDLEDLERTGLLSSQVSSQVHWSFPVKLWYPPASVYSFHNLSRNTFQNPVYWEQFSDHFYPFLFAVTWVPVSLANSPAAWIYSCACACFIFCNMNISTNTRLPVKLSRYSSLMTPPAYIGARFLVMLNKACVCACVCDIGEFPITTIY